MLGENSWWWSLGAGEVFVDIIVIIVAFFRRCVREIAVDAFDAAVDAGITCVVKRV
jgi:hypothetical protein